MRVIVHQSQLDTLVHCEIEFEISMYLELLLLDI